MASPNPQNPDSLGHHVIQLPRELRDIIYAYAVTQDRPIILADTTAELGMGNSMLSAEILEAVYTHNTFVVAFSDPHDLLLYPKLLSDIWGPHLHFTRFIRNVIVMAPEVELWHKQLLDVERECMVWRPEVRSEWLALLDLPHLEGLTINMQKNANDFFFWANFSPIIYQVRETRPKIRITFNISFDAIFEHEWHKVEWNPASPSDGEVYEPMGFVDVSEFITRPSEEDRAYVKEYGLISADGKEDTLIKGEGIDSISGLMSETRANKRLLAPHYVVKEPALLRVSMEEHWGVYRELKKEIQPWLEAEVHGEGDSTSLYSSNS